MTMRLMSPIPARVIQVLQDFLPAELDLIDAEEGGDATPDVPVTNYHRYDRRPITAFPAIALRCLPTHVVDVRWDTFGQRGVFEHRIDVLVHLQIADAGDNALTLQTWMHRYTDGIFRVLCVMKEGLQTSADPTRFVELVTPAGDIDYGPQEPQAQGEIVRTGIVPIRVRRTEARS
jgi:hypothetical protein